MATHGLVTIQVDGLELVETLARQVEDLNLRLDGVAGLALDRHHELERERNEAREEAGRLRAKAQDVNLELEATRDKLARREGVWTALLEVERQARAMHGGVAEALAASRVGSALDAVDKARAAWGPVIVAPSEHESMGEAGWGDVSGVRWEPNRGA